MNATETNTALLESVAADEAHAGEKAERERAKEQALREEAEATYFSILADATRTSDKDKAALVRAMKTLNKTAEDAEFDARIIDAARSRKAIQAKVSQGYDAVKAAEAASIEYTSQTCRRIHQEMKDGIRHRNEAIRAAERELKQAGDESNYNAAFLKEHGHRIPAIDRYCS